MPKHISFVIHMELGKRRNCTMRSLHNTAKSWVSFENMTTRIQPCLLLNGRVIPLVEVLWIFQPKCLMTTMASSQITLNCFQNIKFLLALSKWCSLLHNSQNCERSFKTLSKLHVSFLAPLSRKSSICDIKICFLVLSTGFGSLSKWLWIFSLCKKIRS